MYPILKVLISILPFARNALRRYVDEVNDVTSAGDIFLHAQISAFWAKKYQLSVLNKILPVSYFVGAEFRSDSRFQNF